MNMSEKVGSAFGAAKNRMSASMSTQGIDQVRTKLTNYGNDKFYVLSITSLTAVTLENLSLGSISEIRKHFGVIISKWGFVTRTQFPYVISLLS